jgi:predicted nuclease of predicted toxin-antitoxin system
VKLLFDENPSPGLVGRFAAIFPECTHVDLVGLHGAPDGEVWERARVHGYTIVSKDNDFRQRTTTSVS